jgi:hypothetical protein
MNSEQTPTGFRLLAQGWSPMATYPGLKRKRTTSTPTGLRQSVRQADATPLGLMLIFGMISQGSLPTAINPGLGDTAPVGVR